MRAWCYGLGVLTLLGCGSRSALPGPPGALAGGAGGRGQTITITGGGAGGWLSDAGSDAPPPPPPCPLVLVGGAADVVSYPDRHALAPSMVAIGPSALAVQAFASGGDNPAHSDIQLLRFQSQDPWPTGFAAVTASQLFGLESHGWANLALSSDQTSLALTWHGDPGGYGRPMFRRWDLGASAPGAPVDIASDGEAVLDMAAGAGTGKLGVGYAGYGYGVVHRDLDTNGGGTATTRPVAVVLDAAGNRLIGPHRVSEYMEYPGRAPSIVWTGATYVMATSFNTCAPGDPLCAPLSVVLTRVRPASGDAYDDSGIDLVAQIAAQPGSAVVGRASLSAHAGRTFVAWLEGESADAGTPRRLYAAGLSPAGELAYGPVLVDPAAPAQSRVTLHGSDLGLTLAWVEDGDTSLDDAAVGRSHVIATHLDQDLSILSTRITIPVTRWNDYGPPRAAALSSPKSLYLVWAGRRADDMKYGYDDVWAARLDCGM